MRVTRALRAFVLCLLSTRPALAQDAPVPKFTFQATLLDTEPLRDRETRLAELLFAGVRAEVSGKGWGAVAEVRGKDGRFRPYFTSDVWLEEGYAFLTTPAGDIRVGKLERQFGLPDESVAGSLSSLFGLTRNPDYGVGLKGERRLGWDTLSWWAAYYGQNDHVAFEEDGFGIESDPGATLRDGLEARATYLFNQGLTTFRPGLSVSSSEVRRDVGSFRRTDLGADVMGSLGPLSLSLSGFRRSGKPDGGDPRLGYQDAWGATLTFAAEFPNVTFRYVYGEWRFPDSSVTRHEHLPSASWSPVKWVRGTIEYASRLTRDPAGEKTTNAFRFGLSLLF